MSNCFWFDYVRVGKKWRRLHAGAYGIYDSTRLRVLCLGLSNYNFRIEGQNAPKIGYSFRPGGNLKKARTVSIIILLGHSGHYVFKSLVMESVWENHIQHRAVLRPESDVKRCKQWASPVAVITLCCCNTRVLSDGSLESLQLVQWKFIHFHGQDPSGG